MASSNGHSTENIRVFVKVRPTNERENSAASRRHCITYDETVASVTVNNKAKATYTYDVVAGPTCAQQSVFERVGRPIADTCLKGYHGTIFAFGQTGSGKTYTIQGPRTSDHKVRGLMPRVFDYLFERINEEQRSKTNRASYVIKVSFVEIYNEKIYDLLEANSFSLSLREDSKRGVYVEGATEYTVESSDDCHRLLEQGITNRRVGETEMNRQSSRSHSVYKITIQSTHTGGDGVTRNRFSQFNMIDLAGSERQKLTGAAGDRLKEASQINKSLSALGNVITGLVEKSRGKERHIPYRDSALTFLLKQALGGNSKTYLIACVSASGDAFGETLSTLRFAKRAKSIRNKAVCNENSQLNLQNLMRENKRLNQEINRLREGMSNEAASTSLVAALGCLNPEGKLVDHKQLAEYQQELRALKLTYKMTMTQEKECREEIKRLREQLTKVQKTSDEREKAKIAADLRVRFHQRKLEILEKSTVAMEEKVKSLDGLEAKLKQLQAGFDDVQSKSDLKVALAEQDTAVHDLKCAIEFLNELLPADAAIDDEDLSAFGIIRERLGHYKVKYEALQTEYFAIKQAIESLVDRVEILQDEADRLEASNDEKAMAITQLESKMKEEKVNYEKEAAKAQQAFEAKLAECTEMLTVEMKSVRERLEKKLKLSQEQMNEVKSAAEMFATQAGTLKKEVKTLKETVSSLGDKVEEKEMLSQQLGEQIQLEHKRHETQVAAFEEQIESLNKQHTVRVAEAKQAYEAKLQAVSTELAEIQENDEEAKKQVQLLRAESSMLKEQNMELQVEMKSLELKVQQEKDKQQQKTAQWQKDLTEKKELWANQHAQTVKALEERQKRNIDTLSLELNQEIQALTLVREGVEKQLKDVKDQAQDAETKIVVLESEKAKVEAEAKRKEVEFAMELDQAKKQIQHLEDTLIMHKSDSEARVNEEHAKAKKAMAIAQKAEFDLFNLKEDNECLCETNTFQESKIKDLENIIREQKKELSERMRGMEMREAGLRGEIAGAQASSLMVERSLSTKVKAQLEANQVLEAKIRAMEQIMAAKQMDMEKERKEWASTVASTEEKRLEREQEFAQELLGVKKTLEEVKGARDVLMARAAETEERHVKKEKELARKLVDTKKALMADIENIKRERDESTARAEELQTKHVEKEKELARDLADSKKTLKKQASAMKEVSDKAKLLSLTLEDENYARQKAQMQLEALRKERKIEIRQKKKNEEMLSARIKEAEKKWEEARKEQKIATLDRSKFEREVKSLRGAGDRVKKMRAMCEDMKKAKESAVEAMKIAEDKARRIKEENARLVGHQNPNQKIQHHMRIKQENASLKNRILKLESELRKAEFKIRGSDRVLRSTATRTHHRKGLKKASLANVKLDNDSDKENLPPSYHNRSTKLKSHS